MFIDATAVLKDAIAVCTDATAIHTNETTKKKSAIELNGVAFAVGKVETGVPLR